MTKPRHAEDVALQRRCVAIAERLLSEVPPALRPIYEMNLEQGRKYCDIVARFGRFPHRNAILGRAPTPEEEAFMETWSERAPPGRAAEWVRSRGGDSGET